METGTYEMLWNCPRCGTKGLLGKTHRHCPSCGAAQDPSARYFPEPGTEKEVTNYEYVGVDRICPYCQTPNSAKAQHCTNCGGALDGSTPVGLIGEVPAAQVQPAVPAAKSGCGKWLLAGCGGLLVIVVLLVVIGSWTKNVDVTVKGHRWERAITIENYAAHSDSAWCDSMPAGAYDVTRSREERSTRQVADGQDCSPARRDNGDGTFTVVQNCTTKYRSEPVYDTRCRFTINRWQEVRTATAAGNSLAQTPHWPAVNLARTGECLGCEREGKRNEQYFVSLEGPKETYECAVDAALWQKLEDGRKVPMKVGVVGGTAHCSSLNGL